MTIYIVIVTNPSGEFVSVDGAYTSMYQAEQSLKHFNGLTYLIPIIITKYMES